MFINNQIYKKHIRNNIRIIRRSLTTVYKNTESIKIAKLFLNFIKLFDFKNISIFLSFDGEINTYPIILQLWLNKKNVYLPVIYSFQEKKLIFSHFTSHSILHYNKYKILEPIVKFQDIILSSDLDIIIVPLVAFDKTGTRLGMGGGFYDSLLKNWRKKNFFPIGYSFDFQLVDYIPKQHWDISLPIIFTPNKIWVF